MDTEIERNVSWASEVGSKGGGFRSHVMGSGSLREQNFTTHLPLTGRNVFG